MITESRLKELASFRGPAVTSLYLDVDGRRYPRITDYELHLDALLRAARRMAEERAEVPVAAVEADLQRIRERVQVGFDRSRVRGVAFFACGDRLFEVVELPRSVRNQVVLNQVPVVRQLEHVLAELPRFMVVLVDRQRARLFHFELGRLLERTEVFDEVPPRVDATDEEGMLASHAQKHVDALAHRHLKHAAEVARRELQQRHPDQVILGGPTEAVAEFEAVLHPYVRDRVAGRISVSVGAPESEVHEAALALEEDLEREREVALVERLREAVGSANGGVAGLEPTLRALYEHRVDTLLVSRGYEEMGWRCGQCGFLARTGARCGMCGADMHLVDDVVGEAIDLAILQRSKVKVCDNADLDVLGRIGALLRF